MLPGVNPREFSFFSFILHRPDFLRSGQLITGQTGLIYKGYDGIGRIINPNNYQPVGSYATVSQLNELKTSVSNGKSLIASAITDKGVSTASDATFQTMSNNIRSIQTAAGSIYDITAHDGTLFDNDTNASYFPFLIINSGGGITVKAAGSDASYRGDLVFHFGIKGANYTKVWAYENNSYSTGESFSIAIYEYEPFDLSTLIQKSYIVGSFNKRYSAQELGFTMSADKVYLIVVKDSGVAKQYIKFIT